MFGRHFGRRRRAPWQEADPGEYGFHERGSWHKRSFPNRLHRAWHERHHGWWLHPSFAGPDDAMFWCAPEEYDHFDRPFGPGGPFGGDPFDEDSRGRRRHRRGDIKYVLLELLAEQPRHGYELIKELEQRYAGFYRPSPGSVYPTLQLLEEAGQLTSEPIDGKRVYTITESGRLMLAEHQQRRAAEGAPSRRHAFRRGSAGPELDDLRRSVMALTAGVLQVARHGTPDQVHAAMTLLDTTRREIYTILARGDADEPAEDG
jgi:DNA-binding PadR family transcriptional regulator